MSDVTVRTLNPLPGTGNTMIAAMTAGKEWAETTLQFTFGNNSALNWPNDDFSTLRDTFNNFFGGKADTNFYFAGMTRSAYAMIDSVSNLDFRESGVWADIDLVIVSTYKPRSNTEGFFQFPGEIEKAPGDYWTVGAFNSGLDYMRVGNERGGGAYANWTVLHEIGHSLGLKHTHYDGGGKNGDPLDEIGRFMDNERYSVMSYNGASQGNAFGHAVSFMALDIAAMQALYGSEDYALGSSTYSLLNARGGKLLLNEGNVDIGRAYYCIWDSGGVDAIDFGSANKSVMINLNDATLDTSGWAADVADVLSDLMDTRFYQQLSRGLRSEITDEWHHAGGFFSRVLTYVNGVYKSQAGGFTIANDVDIENAFGGNMADLLIGNEENNLLHGFGGNDTLLGSSGNDTLDGGAGRDQLLGGEGNDTLLGGDGNDVVDGGEGNDSLTGGLGSDRFVFKYGSGSDTIEDLTADDVIDLRDWGLADVSEIVWTDDGTNITFDFGDDILFIRNVDIEDVFVLI